MTTEAIAFEKGIEPVLKIILPEKINQVLGLRPDPRLQERISELATKSTEGELTPEERAEYEGYVRANKFTAILRQEALRMANREGA